MIEIDGLTKRQKAMCEILWGMETLSQVQNFVLSLPHADRLECKTLMDLMVMASIDEVNEVSTEVKDLIDNIRCQ